MLLLIFGPGIYAWRKWTCTDGMLDERDYIAVLPMHPEDICEPIDKEYIDRNVIVVEV